MLSGGACTQRGTCSAAGPPPGSARLSKVTTASGAPPELTLAPESDARSSWSASRPLSACTETLLSKGVTKADGIAIGCAPEAVSCWSAWSGAASSAIQHAVCRSSWAVYVRLAAPGSVLVTCGCPFCGDRGWGFTEHHCSVVQQSALHSTLNNRAGQHSGVHCSGPVTHQLRSLSTCLQINSDLN